MKLQNISRYALLAVVGLSLVVFFVFFGLWGDEKMGEYDAPAFTDLLLVWMYILGVVTTVLTVWSVVKTAMGAKSAGSGSASGVPSTKITVCTWALFVASLVIGYVIGLGAEEFVAADGTVTSSFMVTITDMFIWSIYILFLAVIVAVGVAMSGVLTKTASK
ncbi:MAG: hypothetical protein IKU79_06510 [Bacteroidaceae bacterium]|jgi:hypothetical protein|nr:hypothetical protein [Bacteroidaceae bacterium]